MNQWIRNFINRTNIPLFIALFLLVSLKAQAATTVTVDNNDKVTVTQPNVQAAVIPVVITQQVMAGDFEGRIVEVDYSQNQIIVQDSNGVNRQVLVTPDMINNYRIGDTVLIHPTTAVTLITMEENPKDFEGEIIRVDMSKSQIVVQDTSGRERRVQLKQGMIGTYKVDDYVRIHLMADLKEAKTIETIRDVRNLEGNIVSVDTSRSQIVVRGADGKDSTVLLRQGQINNYRMGDHVRIYLLANHEQVQVIRII